MRRIVKFHIQLIFYAVIASKNHQGYHFKFKIRICFLILMQFLQVLSMVLPIIALVIGIVLTEAIRYGWHRVRRKETILDDYRKLLKDLLKEYLAPFAQSFLTFFINYNAHYEANTLISGQSELRKGFDDFRLKFIGNFGTFYFIIPWELLELLAKLESAFPKLLHDLKKNVISDDLINKVNTLFISISLGLRKIFGIEAVEKTDVEFKQFIKAIEIVSKNDETHS